MFKTSSIGLLCSCPRFLSLSHRRLGWNPQNQFHVFWPFLMYVLTLHLLQNLRNYINGCAGNSITGVISMHFSRKSVCVSCMEMNVVLWGAFQIQLSWGPGSSWRTGCEWLLSVLSAIEDLCNQYTGKYEQFSTALHSWHEVGHKSVGKLCWHDKVASTKFWSEYPWTGKPECLRAGPANN